MDFILIFVRKFIFLALLFGNSYVFCLHSSECLHDDDSLACFCTKLVVVCSILYCCQTAVSDVHNEPDHYSRYLRF